MKTLLATAHIVGQRLDLKNFRTYESIRKNPMMIQIGSGYAVLFRYGVVVLFGEKNDPKQLTLLKEAQVNSISPLEEVEPEVCYITEDKGEKDRVTFDGLHLQDLEADRLLVIADILAKSQILSLHEARIANAFDKIEPIAAEMQQKGRPNGRRTRDLLRYTAATLAAQRNMAGQAEILDKPDFLWEKPPALERLYFKLEDEYEIRERHDALKEKLDLIYRTSEMMIGLLNSRHTLHVEWYIVILIILDILIHISETYIF